MPHSNGTADGMALYNGDVGHDECPDGAETRQPIPELAQHVAAARKAYADLFVEPLSTS